MSYVRSREGLAGIKDVVNAASGVLADPALPALVSELVLLRATEKKSAGPPSKGIGLRDAVPPVRIFRKYRERPWMLPVVAGAAFALPFALGYVVGRTAKRG